MAEAEETSGGASRTGWRWRNLGRNPRPPGLRATIIATLIIAGLTPLAIVLALHLLVVEPRLQDGILKEREQLALEVGAVLNGNLFERTGDVQAFALNSAARDPTAWRRPGAGPLVEAMNGYVRLYGIYRLVLVVSPVGEVLAVNSVDANGRTLSTAALVGSSVADERWFSELPSWVGPTEPNPGVAVSPAQKVALVGRLYGDDGEVVPFAAPVRNADGRIVAIWINFVDFSKVGSISQDMIDQRLRIQKSNQRFQVVGPNGVVIHDSQPSAVHRLEPDLLRLLAARPAGAAAVSGVWNGEVVAAAPAPTKFGSAGPGWTTVVREDAAVAFAPVTIIRRIVGGTLVLTALGLLAFGLWYGQRLSAPILALAERMRRLAAGDTASSRGHTGQGDDIGQMAQAVEVFRQALIEKDLSSARRSLAMEAADIGSWDFDVGTGEMIGDARCEAIFGALPGAFLDYAGFLTLLHPLDRDRLDTLVQQALDPTGPGLFQAEYRIIGLTDGVERWVSARGRGIVEAGVTTRLIGTVVDVTERKRVEAKLRESEERRLMAMDAADIWPWEFNPRTRMLSIPPGAGPGAAPPGLPADVVVHYDVWEQLVHPDDRDRIADRMAAALDPSASGLYNTEYRVMRPDLGERWVSGMGKAHFADGEAVRLIGTAMDITDRKRAEAQAHEREQLLRDVQAELAHANRVATTGHLAGAIAHDVNQPVAAAMTNAAAGVRWLSADPPNIEEAKLSLAGIVKSCRRAGEIIEGMRALVKKDTTRTGPVALNAAVAEIVALTRNEAERNRVQVRTQLAGDLPLVEGDRVQLQQVILNLVINAVQAMSGVDGPRDLLITTATTRNGVIVAVEDSGPGFPAEQAKHLFDPFYTTKESGLGLGLAICRSIADAHGGRLSAMANTPRGARFEFSLPPAPTADP